MSSVKNLEIHKTLVVSTGHVSKDDYIGLQEAGARGDLCTEKLKFGLNLLLSDEEDEINETDSFIRENMSNELFDLVQIARKNNCYCLCLDEDGSIYEELPVFNW
jgi:hypothetical protein